MPYRHVDWPWAHHKLEGTGPTIDDAVVIPSTPFDEVRAYLDTPDKLASWFGATFDATHNTLTISRRPTTLTIAGISTERIDRGRCHTLTGTIANGQLRSYVSTRTVICQATAPGPARPAVGYGTEVWTHIDLPRRTPHAVVRLFVSVIRCGNRHLREELGT